MYFLSLIMAKKCSYFYLTSHLFISRKARVVDADQQISYQESLTTLPQREFLTHYYCISMQSYAVSVLSCLCTKCLLLTHNVYMPLSLNLQN